MSEDRPKYDATPREDSKKGSSRKAFLVRLSPDLHAELKRWADALSACNSVLDSNPDQRLQDKANQRIQSIELKRSSPSET